MASNKHNVKKVQTLTTDQRRLQSNVDAMKLEIPRYLFRFWSPSSGGNSRLNTIDAITPLAFLDTQDVPSFYQIPQSKIAQIAEMHLCGGSGFKSLFSSWSQSLQTVLGMGVAHYHDGYISILDTQDLPDSNVVLHTCHTSKLFGTSCYAYEFLAFGTISGTHHKAVSLQKFLPYIQRSHISPGALHTNQLEPTTTDVIKIAKNFGSKFAVVVATHLLAPITTPEHIPSLKDRLSNIAWPDICTLSGSVASITDPLEKSYFGMVEAWKAAQILQDLALRRYCRSGLHLGDSELVKQKLKTTLASLSVKPGNTVMKTDATAPKKTTKPQKTDGNKTKPKPKSLENTNMILKSNSSVLKSLRMTREMKNLYIDMIGWEKINDDITASMNQMSLVS